METCNLVKVKLYLRNLDLCPTYTNHSLKQIQKTYLNLMKPFSKIVTKSSILDLSQGSDAPLRVKIKLVL